MSDLDPASVQLADIIAGVFNEGNSPKQYAPLTEAYDDDAVIAGRGDDDEMEGYPSVIIEVGDNEFKVTVSPWS